MPNVELAPLLIKQTQLNKKKLQIILAHIDKGKDIFPKGFLQKFCEIIYTIIRGIRI
jgi:hypothetical protein